MWLIREEDTLTIPQRLTSMAKSIDWAVNVDKLRVCYNMPENLYDYLRMQDTRGDELTDSRILDEETFSLVFIEEDEVKMTADLNVRDVEGYYRLGTLHSVIVLSMHVRHSSPLRIVPCTVIS